jgi:hypothetical protein
MQKIYDASLEELEFYEFKAGMKKELLDKATEEEFINQYTQEFNDANLEIRNI